MSNAFCPVKNFGRALSKKANGSTVACRYCQIPTASAGVRTPLPLPSFLPSEPVHLFGWPFPKCLRSSHESPPFCTCLKREESGRAGGPLVILLPQFNFAIIGHADGRTDGAVAGHLWDQEARDTATWNRGCVAPPATIAIAGAGHCDTVHYLSPPRPFAPP